MGSRAKGRSMNAPLTFSWDGEAMCPVGRARTECDQRFVVGMKYVFEEVEDEVSSASRGHFFASIRDLWETLTDDQRERFPSSDALRKWALIESGFCHELFSPCPTTAEAVRQHNNLMLMAAMSEDMSSWIISREGTVVRVLKPKSQKARLMKKAEFEASKKACFKVIAEKLGVAPDHLERNAGMAA